jgi:polysaccharide deacetylase 2 family uncharacterized protein YibQ
MGKRKSKDPLVSPRVLGLLAVGALLLFAIGEGVRWVRSDAGQLAIARRLHLADSSRLTLILGKQIRRGLEAVAVARDSIHESVVADGPAPVHWRVGLKPDASLLQANYAITRAVEDRGAVVLSGSERWNDRGAEVVSLLIGLPGRPTHEVQLTRAPRGAEAPENTQGRLALVLFGLGDGRAAADSFFTLPASFAVALVPGGHESAAVFAGARERGREVVLHVPLEPINYPRVNPGPGTLLVTMKPEKIAATLRRYLAQAGPVSAVANHMGSLATQDMTVMGAIYHELRRDHLPFLHVNPVAGAVCKSLASQVGVLYGEPDAVVEVETRGTDTKALDKRWKELLKSAKAQGQLMVFMRATPLTKRWLPRALDAKRLDGVSIVPVSSILTKPPAL